MPKTRQEIAQQLLKLANYYWHDQDEDKVNPLNVDDYDPVVDKLFKAVSVELEKLYAEIEDSRQEVVLKLAKTLVPDQALLPEPGYTVARLRPKGTRLKTEPEDSYQIAGQSADGNQYEFYFTPLFQHDFPGCELAAIVTDEVSVQVKNDTVEVIRGKASSTAVSSAWYGFAVAEIRVNDVIPCYVGNQIADEFDKDIHGLGSARWLVNGEEKLALEVLPGVEPMRGTAQEEPAIDIPAIKVDYTSYEQQVVSRFRHSFLSFQFPFAPGSYVYDFPPELQGSPLVEGMAVKEALLWIKAEFVLPVSTNFLVQHLLHPNSIPLVNRRLTRKRVAKRNFDLILLPMPTIDYFLGVHQVQDTIDREQGTAYRKVDFMHPEQGAGSYVLRGGARLRRLDQAGASRQIDRILGIIRDEYQTFKEKGVSQLREDFTVIDKAIKRVKDKMPEYFRAGKDRTTFYGIAHFRSGVRQLEYTYWETQADAINELAGRVRLEVRSNSVKIGKSNTVIPIQRGKGGLSADDYLNQMKISLLSRGRIMTKADIKRFANAYYGRLLEVTDIRHALMVLADGSRGRGILVKINLRQGVKPYEAENLVLELQNDLNAKSAFFTQIKVVINGE